MKISLGKENAYKEWYDKNSDDYSRACFTFAERWAELLEKEIENSDDILQTLLEKADILSHEADTEGITGFMYGCALNILAHCWEYGEYLRKWHNIEYGYDCIINPAIITLGDEV